MSIRVATAGDVPRLVALEAELFGPDAWSEGAVRDELEGPGRRALVADEHMTVVGYAITMASGSDVVDLQRIGVAPAHRRGGVATRLLEAAAVHARQRGAHRMLLEVSAANSTALAFYARAGFGQIDRRCRYYRDGTDAVVLERSLGSAAHSEGGWAS